MAMPTGPLSSNWELLRKRLDAAAPPKRKPAVVAAVEKEEPAKKKLKRRRADDGADTSVAKKSRAHKDAAAPRKRTVSMSASTAADEKTPASGISASLALWAENNDIPAEDLARAYGFPLNTTKVATAAPVDGATLEPEEGGAASKTESGRYVAMDCEMVGVGEGEHESSALARVSIVNFHGHCVLDCFVKPKEKVTDWRTWVSGVSPKDMVNAITFEEAQNKVADILDSRILVGHAIKNDLECLLIGHPKRDIRDTSRHPEFRKYSKGRTPGLKKLAKEILGIEIQGGSHSSIEDARACMLLYRRFKEDFEREHQIHFPNQPKKSGGGKKKKKKSKK